MPLPRPSRRGSVVVLPCPECRRDWRVSPDHKRNLPPASVHNPAGSPLFVSVAHRGEAEAPPRHTGRPLPGAARRGVACWCRTYGLRSLLSDWPLIKEPRSLLAASAVPLSSRAGLDFPLILRIPPAATHEGASSTSFLHPAPHETEREYNKTEKSTPTAS